MAFLLLNVGEEQSALISSTLLNLGLILVIASGMYKQRVDSLWQRDGIYIRVACSPNIIQNETKTTVSTNIWVLAQYSHYISFTGGK